MTIVVQLVDVIVTVLTIAIFVRVILSWFMLSTRNQMVINLYQAIAVLTEPILGPLRRIVPTLGRIDISPIVAIVLLQVIRTVVIQALS